ALVAVPFCWLPPELAAALFMGMSAGFISFGITRKGWNRLLIFGSYPFWASVVTVQWTPIVMAAGLLPWLYPIVVAKPHISLPVALQYITRKGVIGAIAIVVVTLLIRPDWPLVWWTQSRGYQGFIPVLGIGAVLLVLLPWAKRDPDSRFLLLMG